MDEYSVDLTILDDVVSRLSGLAGFLSDQFAELDRRAASVHAGSWSGVAADAHAEAHAALMRAAVEFVQGVTDMHVAARTAHTAYAGGLAANTKMFGQR